MSRLSRRAAAFLLVAGSVISGCDGQGWSMDDISDALKGQEAPETKKVNKTTAEEVLFKSLLVTNNSANDPRTRLTKADVETAECLIAALIERLDAQDPVMMKFCEKNNIIFVPYDPWMHRDLPDLSCFPGLRVGAFFSHMIFDPSMDEGELFERVNEILRAAEQSIQFDVRRNFVVSPNSGEPSIWGYIWRYSNSGEIIDLPYYLRQDPPPPRLFDPMLKEWSDRSDIGANLAKERAIKLGSPEAVENLEEWRLEYFRRMEEFLVALNAADPRLMKAMVRSGMKLDHRQCFPETAALTFDDKGHPVLIITKKIPREEGSIRGHIDVDEVIKVLRETRSQWDIPQGAMPGNDGPGVVR